MLSRLFICGRAFFWHLFVPAAGRAGCVMHHGSVHRPGDQIAPVVSLTRRLKQGLEDLPRRCCRARQLFIWRSVAGPRRRCSVVRRRSSARLLQHDAGHRRRHCRKQIADGRRNRRVATNCRRRKFDDGDRERRATDNGSTEWGYRRAAVFADELQIAALRTDLNWVQAGFDDGSRSRHQTPRRRPGGSASTALSARFRKFSATTTAHVTCVNTTSVIVDTCNSVTQDASSRQ